MKRWVLLMVLGFASYGRAMGLEVGAGAGASVPYDGSGIKAGPSVKASVMARTGPFLSLGVVVGQDMNFVPKKQGYETPAAIYGPNSNAAPHINITNTTNNNTTNVFPQAVTSEAPGTDKRASDILYFEPTIRAGYPVGLFYPFVQGSFGGAKVKTQDRSTFGGTSYGWGGGVRISEDKYFLQVEASVNAIETEAGVYRVIRPFVSGGVRF